MNPSTRLDEARTLAEQTLNVIEVRQESLTQIVLRCLRIARLLAYEDVSGWLHCELRGYEKDVIAAYTDWERYAHWSARQLSANDKGVWTYEPAPIELVESRLALAREDYASARVPPSIPEPSETPSILVRSRGATAFERVLATMRQDRFAKTAEIERYSRIVASLRGAIYEWLSRTCINLQYGAIVDSAFARTKERFDTFLAERAPAAAKALAAAYARSDVQDSEERSQALTSCRRALKALADVLYPATKDESSERDLSEEKYKNRLIEFVANHLRSASQSAVFDAEIELVAARADALNDLASKGVHSETEAADLELVVVHTYLLAGELLSLLPETEIPNSSPASS